MFSEVGLATCSAYQSKILWKIRSQWDLHLLFDERGEGVNASSKAHGMV